MKTDSKSGSVFHMFDSGNAQIKEAYLTIFKILFIYGAWKLFRYYVSLPDSFLHSWWTGFIHGLGSAYAYISVWVLNVIGVRSYPEGIDIVFRQYNTRIWVQEHCLAIPAMVIFVGTVVSFRGHLWEKIGFVFLGLLGIALINVIRLVLVSLAWIWMNERFFHLHHSVIYVVLTYTFIFLMLRWWMLRNVSQRQEQGNVQS